MILPFKTNILYHVQQWYGGASTEPNTEGDKITETTDLDDADIVTSKQRKQPLIFDDELDTYTVGESLHTPVLDIDIPAMLVPSSTPGRHHLYLDAPMPWETYVKLLDAMQEAGILEPGYVSASKERGFTAVRLPWIRKG